MSVETDIQRWQDLRSRQDGWQRHWDDLARVMLPRRQGFTSDPTPGESRTEDLFDGTPMQAARGLSNAIGGMLRPIGRDWFSLRADNDAVEQTDEAKEWLARATEITQEAFEDPAARFQQATGEMDIDLVVFGTAIGFINSAEVGSDLLFQSVHLKDCAPFFSAAGTPRGMYRRRVYKLRQAIEEFGQENLSEEAQKAIQADKLDDKLEVLHVVVPREEGSSDALLARNLPYTSTWIEVENRHRIREGGFHEFPFVVPRWDTSSGEDFGRSPGMVALPDANTLQAMGETMLVAGQRAATPPLAVPNDGAFDAINTMPDGLTYYDVDTAVQMRGNPFFPLETGAKMPLTRDMQHDMRNQVFAAFFRNVLNLPVDGPEMTATEVIQRKEEFIREIGPVFGRLESDYTAPMVERAFKILLRAGRFPPIPESLEGQRVGFEYESPVKRIREQTEASAAAMWANQQFERAAVRPEAADLVDVDALGRFEAEAAGLPHSIVSSRREVEQRRQARAQAQQRAQQAEQAEQMATTAKTAAEAGKAAGVNPEAA